MQFDIIIIIGQIYCWRSNAVNYTPTPVKNHQLSVSPQPRTIFHYFGFDVSGIFFFGFSKILM